MKKITLLLFLLSFFFNVNAQSTAGCGDSIDIVYESSFNGLLYSFSAPSGQYASVTVGGEAENNYDFMWITDGSGNDLYGSSASPITGVLSGTYESTDGTILIYLNSDSSVTRTMTFEFNCYDPPSCIAPTALSATATSSTEATVSWTAGDSETAWEYVYQAAGTGEPTGAGTATTTNPLSLTGLASNTAYEIYLRADCGGDFSPWVNTSFVTSLDCGDSIDITYENNFNGLIYSFSAPSGQYASVTVGGQTESCCDDMWITDGSGNALYGSQGSPIAGALSGTFESTDGTILIYVNSDSSVSYTMTFEFNCYDPPVSAPDCATNFTNTVDPSCGNVDFSVSWDAVVGAGGYFITAGTTSGGNDLADAEDLGTSTTYNFTALIAQSYYYTITPYNLNGNADSCEEQSVTTASDGCYCVSSPTSVDGNGLRVINLQGTEFASAGTTNEDFTATPVDVSQSTTASLELTWDTGYTYYTNVWVDFNDDYNFDSTELVATGASPSVLDLSFSVPLTAPLGEHRLRIVGNYSSFSSGNPCYSSSWATSIDMTINVIDPPACLPPTLLTHSSSATDATVSWTAGGSETAWEYVVQPLGGGEPSGAGTATTTNPISLSGLTSNTAYEFWLRADCGGDFSPWVNTSFVTSAGCGDSVSITYENSFNGLVYSFSAPSGQYASVTVGGQTESCCDDMWITDGSGNPLYGSQASPIAGSLSGTYESTDGTILIYVDSDGSINYEMTFAFSCSDPPSCIAPTGLSASATSPTQATVSWTAGDSETAWEYVYQAASTGEPTGAGTATTTNPLSLSGLIANTDYEIYLRADCGGDFSPWVSTDFTTPPAPIVPDYINDFSTFPGDLWSTGSPTNSFTSAWLADGFANDGSTGAAKSNIYSSNNIQVLESPIFDLSGGVYYLNMKAAVTQWNNTNAFAMGSDDSVSVSVSVDGGNYDVLHTWNESNNPGPTGTNMPEVELDAYSSANVKFLITMSDGTVDDPEDYDFFIDDFQITSTSLGIKDLSTLQFTYFPNPVNDKLTINAQTNIDNIVVLNMLGQVVSRQSPNSLNCLVDMAAMRTGVYFVQVSIGNNTQTIRLLKQ